LANIVNGDFNLGKTATYSGQGAAPDLPGNIIWNGLALTGATTPGTAEATSTFTGLAFSDGTPSGLSVTIKRTNQSGVAKGKHAAIDLLRDSAHVNSGDSAIELSATFTIDGLTAGTTYNLYLYGVGTDLTQKTAFTIGGTKLQTTGASAATSDLTAGEDYVRFTGIVPNASNQIIVTYANVIDGANPSKVGLFNGFQIVEVLSQPLPKLELRPLNSSELQLAWPSDATGFELETSIDLSLWSPVLDTPAIIAGEFTLPVTIIEPRRFYRLRRP